VGRLSYEKNLLRLIEALASVIVRRGATAILCGSGPLEAQLRARIESLGVTDRLLLTGYVDTVWSLLHAADVFVAVSHFEGQPNAVLEAMAAGCPMVLSDIPAHREVLDDGAALFVDGDSAPEIAAAIERLIDSPEMARSLAERARCAAEGRSPARIATEYERLYQDVMEGARSRA
jgi:glycosyltransferase involved in cell wall biosynthesis